MESATRQRIEGNWDQVRGRVKQASGELTDDDLDQISGQADELVGLLKGRTGKARQEIEAKLDEIVTR